MSEGRTRRAHLEIVGGGCDHPDQRAHGRAQGCPLKERGLELRPMCSGCDGHAAYGQHHYPRRTPLYLEGDPADFVYGVVEGCLREVRSTIDGRIQPVRLVRPGELAGIEALSSATYHASLESVSRVLVCRVPVTHVQSHLEEQPEQAGAFLAEVIAEMRAVQDSVLWIGAFTAEERVLALLHLLVDPEQRGTFADLPLTRLEMSEFLGLAHATVSRTLQRLSRRGVIEVRGRRIRMAVTGAPQR